MDERASVRSTVIVALGFLAFVSPFRRLLTSPGMPWWSMFVAWAFIVGGIAFANRSRA